MDSALGWEPVSNFPTLHARVDDFSIQISSSVSKTFFVRLLTDLAGDELVFSDFNHASSETMLAANAIRVLHEDYDIEFAGKLIRVRTPSENDQSSKVDCVNSDWPDDYLRSMEESLQLLGVSVLSSSFQRSSNNRKDLLIRTVKL